MHEVQQTPRGIRDGGEPFCHFIKIGRRQLLPVEALAQLNARAGVASLIPESPACEITGVK